MHGVNLIPAKQKTQSISFGIDFTVANTPN